jgi:oligopeptide transport system substrate-binding protein
VRRALALAIDRDYITEYVTKGGEIPATGYTPPGLPGYEAPQMLRYDPAEARKLLAQAGYPDGKGFPPFEILFNRDDNHTKIAESVQSMWKNNLGVTVTLHPEEWKVYLSDRRVLKFDVARAAWIGDYVDPNTFLSNFLSGSGNNQTGWKNPRYDNLLKEANRMLDPVARAAKLREAETLLLTEMPMIPIYYYVNYDMYDDQRWMGIHGNALGEYKPQEIRARKPGEAPDPYR